MAKPTDVVGVRIFVGMADYLSKYLKYLTDLSEPLRQLTHKDAEFVLTATPDEAFRKLKEAVTRALLLKYFDLREQAILQCDASSTGLRAAML